MTPTKRRAYTLTPELRAAELARLEEAKRRNSRHPRSTMSKLIARRLKDLYEVKRELKE